MIVSRGVGWGGSRRCGGDQRVGDSGGGAVERSGAVRQHDPSRLLWLTTHGDDLDTGRRPHLDGRQPRAIRSGRGGQEIARRSPFKHTLFSGYSNGRFGYMPVRSAYPEGGYEVETSPFAPGAAELVIEESLRMLHELRESEKDEDHQHHVASS